MIHCLSSPMTCGWLLHPYFHRRCIFVGCERLICANDRSQWIHLPRIHCSILHLSIDHVATSISHDKSYYIIRILNNNIYSKRLRFCSGIGGLRKHQSLVMCNRFMIFAARSIDSAERPFASEMVMKQDHLYNINYRDR